MEIKVEREPTFIIRLTRTEFSCVWKMYYDAYHNPTCTEHVRKMFNMLENERLKQL